MSDRDWLPFSTQHRPENGQRVDWLSPSGQLTEGGIFENGLWFLPAGDYTPMYVYYTPVFWRPARAVS